MADMNVIRQHIEIRQGARGPKAMIAGHRIRVVDIVRMHDRYGHSPAEIVELLPTITLADVHAALAYYCDNREALDQWMADEEAYVEEMRRLHPGRIDVRERLKQRARE